MSKAVGKSTPKPAPQTQETPHSIPFTDEDLERFEEIGNSIDMLICLEVKKMTTAVKLLRASFWPFCHELHDRFLEGDSRMDHAAAKDAAPAPAVGKEGPGPSIHVCDAWSEVRDIVDGLFDIFDGLTCSTEGLGQKGVCAVGAILLQVLDRMKIVDGFFKEN